MIDLRSDTVTQPTPTMRAVMANAPVGDDVLGDDPSVADLEAEVAGILGQEAAVFMPSGTMTNQVAVRAHTEPSDEIFLDAQSHIYYYEGGGPAALSGVMCHTLPGERGILTAAHIRDALRLPNAHYPRSRLVCLENTHNRGGGTIYPLSTIQEIAQVCREHGLGLHLDGARLWNAAVATGIPEQQYCAPFDSVSVCFSKGLGAPVGSALAGTEAFIARARRFRKLFGGGMRQAGILAAAALYALHHHRERLQEDHHHAQILYEQLIGIPEIHVLPPPTNILMVHTPGFSAPVLADHLRYQGVAVLAAGTQTLRLVTHLGVSREQIHHVFHGLQTAFRDTARDPQPQ